MCAAWTAAPTSLPSDARLTSFGPNSSTQFTAYAKDQGFRGL